MLVVKIELWPGGDKSRAKEIGRAEIANLSGLAEVSDYSVLAESDGKREAFGVRYHEHSDGAWALVRRVAEEMAYRLNGVVR